MKKLLFVLFALALKLFAVAQTYNGMADYNKIAQAAVIGEYKYPQQTVENTLRDKLERLGLKIKNNKGYMVLNNSVISSINSMPLNYAFMVDRKSKQEKDITLIYMVITTDSTNVSAVNGAIAKIFLAELTPAIDAANTDNMVDDQNREVTKAQKKYKNLQEEQTGIEKKIKTLQDDLAKNAQDQADQQKEVERQQGILDTLKAKKGN